MTATSATVPFSTERCPLCGSPDLVPLKHERGRRFRDCSTCRLVSADPGELPDAETERARYDTHRNDPTDPGYRHFLEPAAAAVAARCPVGARGLDYGAGPGPALAQMLAERGYPTALYDPFYHPDPAPLARPWAFVTCTETVEHFHRPINDFTRLAGLLASPDAPLVIMTQPLTPDVDFASWWYARDLTHVAFYRPETFEWLGEHFAWQIEVPHPSVTVFQGHSGALAAGGTSR